MTATMLSFIGFLLIFFFVGIASVSKSKGNSKDYYLAGQSVSPLFSGLSAVATNNSGYMFIGVIGYTYQVGLSAMWLMIGWIAGDYVASKYIHKKLHHATTDSGETSYSSVLAKWAQPSGGNMRLWQLLAGLLTLVFLGAYAAAQISAGSKALTGVLGWDRTVGAVVVALMVLAYSVAGGIRASIWTDVVQSVVMLIAMVLLVFIGFDAIGGFSQVVTAWQAIPNFLNWMPQDLAVSGLLGLGLFIAGWFVAGFGVIGQPHIMVRFMALKDADSMQSARLYYYLFFIVFYVLATLAGMLARLHLPDLTSLDPEMALPTMAVQLLPAVLVGVVLAGIFAATMSTADSLILSCSSAITNDLLPNKSENPIVMKLATAFVTGAALLIALYASSSVFDLVIMAWSVMTVVFAPMLILLVAKRSISQMVAIVMMVVGVVVALLWREFGLHNSVFEGLPAVAIALLIGFMFSKKINE
jgi:SSS family solute:Na+ symporter/sodium/proline symporter